VPGLCRQLHGLRVLEFIGGVGEASLTAMAKTPWLGGLTTLAIRQSEAIPYAAATLSSSPFAPRLSHVDWDAVQPGPRGLGLLAASPVFAEVVSLRLARCGLGADDVRALAERLWRRLRRLDLKQARLDGQGSKALAAMGMPVLRRLELQQTRLTAADLRELLAAPWCAGLESLDLSGNDLGDVAAVYLAGAPCLANLRQLRLAGCGLSAEGARALARSPHLARLQTLDLRANSLGTAGLQALGEGELPALTALTVGLTQATVEGVKKLTNSPLAERLLHLDLSENNLTDESFAALASSRLAGLKDLRLSDVNCTAARAALLARGPFEGLVRLALNSAAPLAEVAPALLGTHGFPALAALDAPEGTYYANYTTDAVEANPRLKRLARLNLGWVMGLGWFRKSARPAAWPPAFQAGR
jgi:hypothetical protein